MVAPGPHARRMRPLTEDGHPFGDGCSWTRIPDSEVRLMRDLYEQQCLTVRDIAERLHRNFHTVKKIVFYQSRISTPRRWSRMEEPDEPRE